ncbi:phosphocarrier protein [Paenibacillaceae bacterium GAS479]|nr:phosphocarrier protein [Paenibacillaceae bacterium GAS479]
MGGIDTKAIIEINQAASRYQSSIVLHAGSRSIDVKSILGLTITLVRDENYTLEIHGSDEAEATPGMLEVFSRHGMRVDVK